MRLIKPSVEILEPKGYSFQSMCQMIELAGRVCYKSEDKITDESAIPFTEMLMRSGHLSALEHGTIYMVTRYGERYALNPFSRVVSVGLANYVTTNYRVLVENGWEGDLQYMCEPTEKHIRRVAAKFICNRQVSHEFVRHRAFSFNQESTRYNNYSKDKHGHELTFIEPCWLSDSDKPEFTAVLSEIERAYFQFLEKGWKPQQAANLLQNALKTELVMTGFVDDSGWKNFFNLRALGKHGKPHPQAQELATALMEKFSEQGWI